MRLTPSALHSNLPMDSQPIRPHLRNNHNQMDSVHIFKCSVLPRTSDEKMMSIHTKHSLYQGSVACVALVTTWGVSHSTSPNDQKFFPLGPSRRISFSSFRAGSKYDPRPPFRGDVIWATSLNASNWTSMKSLAIFPMLCRHLFPLVVVHHLQLFAGASREVENLYINEDCFKFCV